MARYRVSADIGGTFTDVIATEIGTGTEVASKVSTTPRDLTEGVLAGLSEVVPDPADIDFLVHGTTQGLNAFLQRRGEKVLLLATEGAGDVYHIARGNRTSLYDIHFRKPTPLVPRRDIVEIPGRLDSRGIDRAPLDEEAVRRAAGRVREGGFGAVAVAFLFSYVNSDHELHAAKIMREELGDDFPLTLSHQVAREWREYERTSSTVLDAYIAPTVRRYLSRLESELDQRGLAAPLHVMQSNGGIVTAAAAQGACLQTLLSGPVGGTMGGTALADEPDVPNLICVDMGGTSFDVSLVVGGEPDVDVETTLEDFPLLLPVVQIHTIGAGGGSVAYAEAGGLRVGPRSAGAEPGPASYARGGTEPTVTDANLVLGRVDPEWFAGGTLPLDAVAAEQAVGGLANQLGLGVPETAEGICQVINAKMAQAIRTITIERGIEPRDHALLAYGGAGSMHACSVAQELGISRVVVPPDPGAFSAWGMLAADLRQDFADPFYAPIERADVGEIAQRLGAMESRGADALKLQGAPPDRIGYQHAVDMRYRGQEYTLTVPITSVEEPRTETFRDAVADRFHDAHRGRFGHSNPGAPTESVTLRTVAFGEVESSPPARQPPVSGSVPEHQRHVVFGGESLPTRVVRRTDMGTGATLAGPALVLEQTATTVLPPGWTLAVTDMGCLEMTRDF